MQGIRPKDIAEFAGGVHLTAIVSPNFQRIRASKPLGIEIDCVRNHGLLIGVMSSAGSDDDAASVREMGTEKEEQERVANVIDGESFLYPIGAVAHAGIHLKPSVE